MKQTGWEYVAPKNRAVKKRPTRTSSELKKLNSPPVTRTVRSRGNTILPKKELPSLEKTEIKFAEYENILDYEKTYNVSFSIINANEILNMCSPEYNYCPKEWTDSEREKRRTIGLEYIQHMNKISGFYYKLEKSILENGINNPIIITHGYPQFRRLKEIPPESRKANGNYLVCEILGGSRLWVAQKYNMMVPVIVSDFLNSYENNISNDDDVRKHFVNPPIHIHWTDKGLKVSPSLHTHLYEYQNDPRVVLDYRRQAMKRLRRD